MQELLGGNDVLDQILPVPIYDVEVAAGYGRAPLDEGAIGSWPLPRAWAIEQFGDNADLRMLRVSGDSQEPELRNGDAVIINKRQNRLATGMHVVRLDDTLMIKRIQLEGRVVRLVSNNKTYPDVAVDLRDDQHRFEIIGKAVWAGKLL